MKRMVSLVLVVAVLLGLLTGFAVANTEENEQTDSFLHSFYDVTDKTKPQEFVATSLHGGEGFWMTLDGEPILKLEGYDAWLNNSRIGELFYNEDDDKYPWGLDFNWAYPGEEGDIVVQTGPDETDLEFIHITTADNPAIGLYRDFSYAPASYIPFRPDGQILYTPGEDVTLYLRVASGLGTISVDTSSNLTKGTQTSDENWIYQPVSFSGTSGGNARIELRWAEDDGQEQVEWNLQFIDQSALMAASHGEDYMELSLNCDRGNIRQYDFYYFNENGETVRLTDENAVLSFSETDMGTLAYDSSEDCWHWDTNSASFDASGMIVAEVGEGESKKTYSMPASVYVPIGLYSGADGTEQQYLPDGLLAVTEGAEDATVHIYLHPIVRNWDCEVMEVSFNNLDAADALSYELTEYGAKITVDLAKAGGSLTTGVAANVSNWGTERFNLSVTQLLQASKEYEGDYQIPDDLGFVPATPEDPFGVYHNVSLVDEEQGIYFGVGVLGGPKGVDRLTRTEVQFGRGSSFDVTCVPMFYVVENGNIIPLANQSSMNATDVSLELYPLSAEEGMLACENTPDIYAGPANWPGSKQIIFRAESEGDYLVVVRATINGTEYTAFGNITALTPEETFDLYAETVEEAEEKMEEFLEENGPLGGRQRLTIHFTGDDALVGPLVMPEGLEGSAVSGNGQVFYGGIENAGSVDFLHFKSLLMKDDAMTAEEAKEQENVSDSVPNYAIYGKIPGGRGACTFEGFYHAIHIGPETLMFNVGGFNNTFINNDVAIYVEHVNPNGGNVGIKESMFVNNDIAIWFKQMPEEGINLSYVSLEKTTFINNGVDVRNDTDQVFWMPMCYFLHTNEKVDLNNLPSHADKSLDQWQAVTVPEAEDKLQVPMVIASPAAVSPDCEKADGYYYPAQIYVSDAIRDLYPIYELEDGMAVTAVDEDDTAIAMVELTEQADTASVEPTAAQEAGTYGLFRLASPVLLAEEQTAAFDSLMEKTVTDTEIALTIGAIPEGYAGTITVACDWDAAYVYHNDVLLESVLEDGYVSFTAVESSQRETYRICKEKQAEDEPDSPKPSMPSSPVKPSEQKPQKPAVSFADTKGHWAEDAVAFVVEKGLFNGTSETTFSPDAPMTRAMLMTVLARLDGENTEGGANWYDKGLAWAVAEGISDGSNPDGSITREQLVTMLWRYAGKPRALGDLSGWPDQDQVSAYARDAMAWAVGSGIINGMDGNLMPGSNATRAQLAVILMRYCAALETMSVL